MKFWQNVLRALDARQMSVRALALAVGVTPGAMSRYSRGSVPSLEVAARIAKRLGLSLDSLVWGDGEEELVPMCDAPGEHALLREITAGMSIEELFQLAELSSKALSWEIMDRLAHPYPKPLSLDELCRDLGDASEQQVKPSLLALRRSGVIKEKKGTGRETLFEMQGPVAHVKLREIGDVCNHVLWAARVLFRNVLPALERQDGSGNLVGVRADVPHDVATRLATDLKELVKARSGEAIASSGTTKVEAIFAVAVSGRDD